MKKIFTLRTAPLWAILWSCLGLGFQLWLKNSGLDAKGLYITNHPAAILSFSLILPALVTLMLCVRPLKTLRKGNDPLPAPPSAVLSFFSAAVLLYCGIRGFGNDTTGLETVQNWGILLCALAVGAAGVFSLTQKAVPFGIYAAITLCFILFVVGSHRTWSAAPQIHIFLFPLLACAFLLLNAYQQTALAANCGHRAFDTLLNALALFFCLTALPLSGTFFGGAALWILAQQWPLLSAAGDRP